MSGRFDDGRLDEAKAISIAEIVSRLGLQGLKRAGRELIGPCPICGGRDRFSVNLNRAVYNCRQCGGGDGVGLVRLVLGCDFRAALDFLIGAPIAGVDPEEQARRRARAKKEEERRQSEAARYRKRAIDLARGAWRAASADVIGSPVQAYLVKRGLPAEVLSRLGPVLRFAPALEYREKGRVIHCGPAMVAAVVDASGALIGAHRTWIDLDRPSGKAEILDPATGAPLPSKKMLGSKKGGAIRLTASRDASGARLPVLVMGEGLETTITAIAAGAYECAAYWCGVDLGNLGGRMISPPRNSGLPDLEDAEAFVCPPWVEHLIFLQDGDSDPKPTRARLEAGLRRSRSAYPALRVSIAHAGAGRDFNDILREGKADDGSV